MGGLVTGDDEGTVGESGLRAARFNAEGSEETEETEESVQRIGSYTNKYIDE